MEAIGSVILEEARKAAVPAGTLSPSTAGSSRSGDGADRGRPEIEVVRAEVGSLDEAAEAADTSSSPRGPSPRRRSPTR